MEKEQFKMIVMATMGWRSCKTNYLMEGVLGIQNDQISANVSHD